MTEADNIALIRWLVEEFSNCRNVAAFDKAFADEFVDHTPQPGADGTKAGFRRVALAIRDAVPDSWTTIGEMIAEGDTVAWHWTIRGTHAAPVMGIPATGKTVTISGITIDRIASGQIVERWSQVDILGLLQQLGVIPGVAGNEAA